MSHTKALLRSSRLLQSGRTASVTRALSTSTESSSSSSSSSSGSATDAWQRPIPEGLNPAYDLALSHLSSTSSKLLTRSSSLLSRSSSESNEKLKTQAREYRLRAEMIDPKIQWVFGKNGIPQGLEGEEGDVYREMGRKEWVERGGLDLLMQRLTTMKVIPDLLPPIHPSMDLRVSYPSYGQSDSTASSSTSIVPGQFVYPSQTINQPEISIQPFISSSTETKYYTLLMVDPDRPDPESYGFKEYVHWIVPNIPINSTTTALPPSTPSLLPYIPPHPSPSTPYHRYTFLLLLQPSSSPIALTEFTKPESRSEFGLKKWAEENGLIGLGGKRGEENVGGVMMVRSGGKGWGKDGEKKGARFDREQNEVVEGIYKDVLDEPMPIWKKAPKMIKYGMPKERAMTEQVFGR